MAAWKRVLVASGDAGTPSALVGTNISGTASGLTSGAVTNGVYTTGTQTIGGAKTFSSQITGSISGDAGGSSASCTGNAVTATTATKVVVSDNESTSEANAITFVADADIDGSTSIGLESDGDFTYNPGASRLTVTNIAVSGSLSGTATNATNLTGNLTGAVTSSGSNATSFSASSIHESHMKINNSPTNGYLLSANDGNTGGLEWVAAGSAANDATLTMATTSPLTGSDTFTANASANTTFTVAIADASTSGRGSVQLSDSTSTTSSVLAATATAVKAAYDVGNGKVSCDETNVSAVLAALDGTDTLNIGDAGNDATINIRGNLTVAGATTQINTTELTINDNKIILNADAVSGEDASIVIEQGNTGADVDFAWHQNKGNFFIDSQGVNSTSTTSAGVCSAIRAANNTVPSASTHGHGTGSMYVLSNDEIYIQVS